MKTFKKSYLVLLCIFTFFSSLVYSQQNVNGVTLCDSLYDNFKQNQLNPQIQLLESSGINTFPYNIIVSFDSKNKKSDKNIYLVFDTQDIYNQQDFLFELTKIISQNEDEFLKDTSIHLVLAYCCKTTELSDFDNVITGVQVFSESLNTNLQNIVYMFLFDSQKNYIISGARGFSSPSWMIKSVYEAFSKQKLAKDLPYYYLSQQSKFETDDKNQLSYFLSNEISAISTQFSSEINSIQKTNLISDILTNTFASLNSTDFQNKDTHAIMLPFFGKRIWLSEYNIVKISIIFFIISVLFLFILSFVNQNLKNQSWNEIKNNWYSIFIILFISIICFYCSRLIYLEYIKNFPINLTAYGLIIFQITFSTFFVSVYFFISTFFQKNTNCKSYDFLLILVTFVNQFIFSFFEISLLPFFLIFCLFSILSLIFKKNWSHIVLFFVMIFSLYPYIYRLFQISEINNLHQLLINNKFLPLFLSLVILPIYILLLRILTSLKKYFPGKKKTIFLILIVNILLFLILFISNRILFTDKKTENNMTQIQIVNDKNIIDIEYHDKYIFSDIIRTVNINSLYEPVLVSFTVSSPKTNPVIYSDNQYIINDINQVSFPLPLYPSDEIEFSYGTNNIEQTLEVNAIYYFDEEDKYISINKKIQIQGSNLE